MLRIVQIMSCFRQTSRKEECEPPNIENSFTTDNYQNKMQIDSETQAENYTNQDSTETIASYL